MSQLIPPPDEIRRRIDEIERERRDLRALLKLAERHHGEEKPVDMRFESGDMKLETK